jgi:hypothetical protein
MPSHLRWIWNLRHQSQQVKTNPFSDPNPHCTRLGDTIAVITVPESAIELLTEDEIFSVRSVAAA